MFLIQDDVGGVYRNSDDSSIILKKDGTFNTISFTHLTKWWSKGTYTKIEDTIITQTIVVFDTLRIPGKRDELRLSCDSIGELITPQSDGSMLWPRCEAEQNVMADYKSTPRRYSPITVKYLYKGDRIINTNSEIKKHLPDYDPVYTKRIN